MKRFVLLSIFASLICLTGCDKENNNNSSEDYQFEATVINKGMDCGETFIISLTSRVINSGIEDGTYYADKLDSNYKIPGLKIYLNCRGPDNDELYACTMMGPTYPHVIIIDCKIIED